MSFHITQTPAVLVNFRPKTLSRSTSVNTLQLDNMPKCRRLQFCSLEPGAILRPCFLSQGSLYHRDNCWSWPPTPVLWHMAVLHPGIQQQEPGGTMQSCGFEISLHLYVQTQCKLLSIHHCKTLSPPQKQLVRLSKQNRGTCNSMQLTLCQQVWMHKVYLGRLLVYCSTGVLQMIH